MAYYALREFHVLPSDFMKMSDREKAFVIGCIDVAEEERKKAEKKAGKRRKRR